MSSSLLIPDNQEEQRPLSDSDDNVALFQIHEDSESSQPTNGESQNQDRDLRLIQEDLQRPLLQDYTTREDVVRIIKEQKEQEEPQKEEERKRCCRCSIF